MKISEQTEDVSGVQKPRLRDLLANEKERQKRSYRRATLFIVLVVLLGAGWLAFSVFNVVKLERRANGLRSEFGQLQQKSSELQQGIDTKSQELKTKELELETKKQELDEIETMLRTGRTNEALQLVSVINEQRPKASNTPRPASAPGFVGNYTYKGPDKTVISVEVIPDRTLLASPQRPRSLYTYELDGRNYFTPPAGNKITFTLDRAAGNPRRLVIILDFAGADAGGYTIIETASAGSARRRSFAVKPKSSGEPITLRFTFSLSDS